MREAHFCQFSSKWNKMSALVMFEVAFTLILHICFSLGESTVVAHHALIKFGLISGFPTVLYLD